MLTKHSPSQFSGKSDEYGLRTDEFFLGAVRVDVSDTTRGLKFRSEHRELCNNARIGNWALREACNNPIYKSIVSDSSFMDVV